ncbi:right-handed parallel beta-helix repeat-containing protein [Treponema primitia]|uniref:right-handed parallel beta-helix repeat-containing protein n=1 Tax=Treponema primitia TaxID=88058 RepID=UPI00025556EB|nr:nuclease [Treponema primitia]
MKKILALTAVCCLFAGVLAAEPMRDRDYNGGPIPVEDAETGSYYVSVRGSDDQDGLGEDRAFKTLRKAVDAAKNSNTKRITIIGILDDKSEAAGNGESVFAIGDCGPDEILITGTGDGEQAAELRGGKEKRVLEIYGPAKLRFEYITVSGGNTDSIGGGIFFENSAELTLGTGVVVRDNHASEGGGLYGLTANLYLRGNAAIRNNTVSTDEAGGILLRSGSFFMGDNAEVSGNTGGGIVAWGSSVTIEGDARISNNSCEYIAAGLCLYISSDVILRGNAAVTGNTAGQSGGGIGGIQSVFVMLENSRISNNTAVHDGGGLYFVDSEIYVSGNAEITGNSAENDGGGIYAHDSVLAVRGASRIAENSAGDDGGGIYITGTEFFLGESASIEDNEAACGGGVCSELGAYSTMEDNSVVQGNSSSEQGGGGLCVGINAFMIMKGGIVRNNEAVYGGGVYIEGGGFKHSGGIISDNNAESGGGVFRRSGVFNQTKGILQDNAPDDFAESSE